MITYLNILKVVGITELELLEVGFFSWFSWYLPHGMSFRRYSDSILSISLQKVRKIQESVNHFPARLLGQLISDRFYSHEKCICGAVAFRFFRLLDSEIIYFGFCRGQKCFMWDIQVIWWWDALSLEISRFKKKESANHFPARLLGQFISDRFYSHEKCICGVVAFCFFPVTGLRNYLFRIL